MKEICICGEERYKLHFSAEQYKIVECIDCYQVRTLTPSNVTRKQFYSKEDVSVYIQNETAFRNIFRRIIKFIKKHKQKGKLLDIGAGVGLLVAEAKRSGFDAHGIEPSHYAVNSAKKYFNIVLEVNIFTSDKINAVYDVVILNHVLEHLPDPQKTIRDIHKILSQSGLLVIGVPNYNCFISRFKKERWQSLIPNQHRWHFSKNTLDNLVIASGFNRIATITDNHSRSVHPWWKRPIYFVIDIISSITTNGEAILVMYKKNDQ